MFAHTTFQHELTFQTMKPKAIKPEIPLKKDRSLEELYCDLLIGESKIQYVIQAFRERKERLDALSEIVDTTLESLCLTQQKVEVALAFLRNETMISDPKVRHRVHTKTGKKLKKKVSEPHIPKESSGSEKPTPETNPVPGPTDRTNNNENDETVASALDGTEMDSDTSYESDKSERGLTNLIDEIRDVSRLLHFKTMEATRLLSSYEERTTTENLSTVGPKREEDGKPSFIEPMEDASNGQIKPESQRGLKDGASTSNGAQKLNGAQPAQGNGRRMERESRRSNFIRPHSPTRMSFRSSSRSLSPYSIVFHSSPTDTNKERNTVMTAKESSGQWSGRSYQSEPFGATRFLSSGTGSGNVKTEQRLSRNRKPKLTASDSQLGLSFESSLTEINPNFTLKAVELTPSVAASLARAKERVAKQRNDRRLSPSRIIPPANSAKAGSDDGARRAKKLLELETARLRRLQEEKQRKKKPGSDEKILQNGKLLNIPQMKESPFPCPTLSDVPTVEPGRPIDTTLIKNVHPALQSQINLSSIFSPKQSHSEEKRRIPSPNNLPIISSLKRKPAHAKITTNDTTLPLQPISRRNEQIQACYKSGYESDSDSCKSDRTNPEKSGTETKGVKFPGGTRSRNVVKYSYKY